MHFKGFDEKQTYTEEDLADCEKDIQKAKSKQRIWLVVFIISLTISIISLTILFVSMAKVLNLNKNVQMAFGIIGCFFLLLSIYSFWSGWLAAKCEVKTLKIKCEKIKILLEGNKKENHLDLDNSNNESQHSENSEDNEITGTSIMENYSKESNGNASVNSVFNVFWALFVGFVAVFINFLMGLSYCLTIIGIPAGITCFKFIPIVFRPAGREIVLNYKSHPVLNTIHFIFGGFESYFVFVMYGILLCITVIGIPLGLQLLKIGKFFLAPFGSKLIFKEQYTNERDSDYDISIFFNQICLEDREVRLNNGKTVPASEAMRAVMTKAERNNICSALRDYSGYREENVNAVSFRGLKLNQSLIGTIGIHLICWLITIPLIYAIYMLFSLLIFKEETPNTFSKGSLIFIGIYLSILTIAFVIDLVAIFIQFNKQNKMMAIIRPLYLKYWKNITTYYPTKCGNIRRELRKNAKNPKNRKSYVVATSIAGLITNILK